MYCTLAKAPFMIHQFVTAECDTYLSNQGMKFLSVDVCIWIYSWSSNPYMGTVNHTYNPWQAWKIVGFEIIHYFPHLILCETS